MMRSLVMMIIMLVGQLCYSSDSESVLIQTDSLIVQEQIVWDKSIPLLLNEVSAAGVGLGGAFGGVIETELLMLGGANFSLRSAAEDGSKEWHKDLYWRNLRDTNAQWSVQERFLDEASSYGVSITVPQGLLLIGGADKQQTYASVWLVSRTQTGFVKVSWPSLPIPLYNACGALVGTTIYVAGGQVSRTDNVTSSHFYALDISELPLTWKELPSWNGASRAYAVAASQSNGVEPCFYLFSGRSMAPDGQVTILQDAHCYNPQTHCWTKLASEGFPVMAGTAVSSGCNHIVLIGGTDGEILMRQQLLNDVISGKKLLADYPDIIDPHLELQQIFQSGADKNSGSLRYFHTITNKVVIKKYPFLIPVTTTAVKFDRSIFLLSGEDYPGHRVGGVMRASIRGYSKLFSWLNISVIAFYFIILAGAGYYFSRKQKSTDDYFRGGGRLPWWAVGLSIFSTALSAVTFMSIPAKAYATDWSYMFLNIGIVLVTPIIIFLYIPYFRRQNITTAYEYLEQRFNRPLRVVCSLFFILFQIGRMGIVLFLPAIALNVVTGFNIFLCIGLMGLVGLLYTLCGGIEAVVWTDAFQAIILLGGVVLAIVYIAIDLPGGVSQIFTEAASDAKFHLGDLTFSLKQPVVWTILLASVFANMTTYGADQTIVQRYVTNATEREARRSVMTNMWLSIPATILFFFMGTALYVYYKNYPAELNITLYDQDSIFPWFIFTRLPDGVSGVLIAGIFAAAMSTLSSSMNSAATSFVIDVLPMFAPSKSITLRHARVATFVLGGVGIVIAFVMASWNTTSLWDEYNRILGLIMGSMGGLFFLGMVTRRANSTGATIGVLSSLVLQFFLLRSAAIHLLLYSVSGFISCFVIGYLASLLVGMHKGGLITNNK